MNHYHRQSTKEMLQTQSAIALFLSEQRMNKHMRNSGLTTAKHMRQTGTSEDFVQVRTQQQTAARSSLSTDNQKLENQLLNATSSHTGIVNPKVIHNQRLLSGSSYNHPQAQNNNAMRRSWQPISSVESIADRSSVVKSQYLSSLKGLTISHYIRKSQRTTNRQEYA